MKKRVKSEQSENITEREKSHAKRENKSVLRRLERRFRKVVRIIEEQSVGYKTTQNEENIRSDKVEK